MSKFNLTIVFEGECRWIVDELDNFFRKNSLSEEYDIETSEGWAKANISRNLEELFEFDEISEIRDAIHDPVSVNIYGRGVNILREFFYRLPRKLERGILFGDSGPAVVIKSGMSGEDLFEFAKRNSV